MRQRSMAFRATALAAVGALATSGCTLIGLAVGSVADAKARRRVVVDGWNVAKIKTGTTVTAILRGGERIEGVYGGSAIAEADPGYTDRYASARSRESAVPLHELGQRVTLNRRSGSAVTGAFAGFDTGAVMVRSDGASTAASIPIPHVASLDPERGSRIEGQLLEQLVFHRRLPVRRQAMIGSRRIPLDEIARLEFAGRGGHKGKISGFLVGAVVDALVVVAVQSSLDGIGGCGQYCVNSCPYVYSFDGRGYVLDAEPFGQSLFESAQRPDWVRLDHLRESDGFYRIRLANELDEIEHVDQLKLLVAEVPHGGRAVPTGDGRVEVLTMPRAPLRAFTLAGGDVLPEVGARDDRVWVSDPFAPAAASTAEVRDGLVLEFERLRGAARMTLALRVRSTEWASHLLARMLALQGRELPDWTARMNADAAARGEFLAALRREGLLTLRLWDGTGWRAQDVLANQGPMVWKEQAVRLDLGGVPGDVVRIRLDATPGLWMVDSAAVDFASEAPAHVTELAPLLARDGHGLDIRAALAAEDGRRFTMRRGDTAELVFGAPVERPGRALVPVLKATGYYSILVPAEGEPDRALYRRLVNEPGAFGRYSQALLAAQLSAALRAGATE